MGSKPAETCGRCAMTSVIDVASGDEDGDGESSARDPFAGGRIEVPESEMRVVALPQILLSRVTDRLDDLATAAIYGR